MKKILVTGASGFIGQYLIDKLLGGRYEIYILKHHSLVSKEWFKNSKIKIFNIDITNSKDFSKIKKNLKFDVVFHLATYIPNNEKWPETDKCFMVNCLGAYNLINFLKNRPPNKLIISSSVSVYQVITSLSKVSKISEQTSTIPNSFYGFSKLTADLLFEKFAEDFNISTVFLRYSSVYGLRQKPNAVLPVFINNAKQGKNLTIFGEGKKVQDFIYIDDVIKANIWALKPSIRGIYNIGSGIGINVVDLAKKIIKVFDSKSKIIFNKSKTEDKSKIVMDISRAQEKRFKIDYPLLRGLEQLKEIKK
ncbi:MAG: NAD-dependent epimerase/dehydratase family protein [Patescibacteria group bacterium]